MSTVINLSSLTADTGFVIQGARAEETAGLKIANAGDINGDGYDDIILGAPLSDLNGQRSGASYVVFGKAGGFGTIDLANLGSAGFVIRGPSTFAYSGLSVGGGGDINGDGFDDLIIGSPYDNRADIVFGKSSGFGTVDLDGLGGANGFTVFGHNAASYAGGAVANADINGDGFDDILIGDPGGYYYSSDRAFAVFGKASGFANVDLTSANTLFQGTMNSETARSLASAGDFNGDGFDDVIIGAPFKSSGRGEVYVIFGKAGDLTTLDPNNLGPSGITLQSAAADDFAGSSVSSAGDVNGDGYDDIIIGAPNNDAGGNNAGAAYVIFGRPGGGGIVDLGNLGSLGFAILGAANAFAGASVAAGDVNGDGLGDVIVGSPGSAEIYVVYGKTGGFGTVSLPSLSDSAGLVIRGPANDGVGNSVSAADVNGDGASDVIVGAAFADAAGNNSGRAYVVFGTPPVPGQTISGGAGNDVLHGFGGNDQLFGLGGNDSLQGNGGNDILEGGPGADTMEGGTGYDWYFVDNAGDVVIEAAGQGWDRVYASTSYFLTAGSEVEEIHTSDVTAAETLHLTGNGFGQYLFGNAGFNRLDGGGGADTMAGYGGADWYFVDNTGDVVTEAAGQGWDRVYASASYVLTAGAEIEEMHTSDASGTQAINFTGNAFGQYLFGNAGNNRLDGGGGADTLTGYGGDDWYFVDSAADVVVEAAGQGSDRVFASTSYVLAPGVEIEEIHAADAAATDTIHLTGNAFGQSLFGNAGFNRLDGGGGADTMTGLGGADWYFVDHAGDVVTEAAGGGWDRVYASLSYTLTAGAEIEEMHTSDIAGTAAIQLNGNGFGQYLFGNAGNNRLDGGAGSDILTAYGGADEFLFANALGPGNVDTVADFQPGVDKLLLENGVFSGLPDGALAAGAFRSGTSAQDADDRIIYNPATGALFFDADGIGAGAQVQFATLQGSPVISSSDFLVI